MGCPNEFLEPCFERLANDETISICCEVMFRTSGRSICRSLIHQQVFVTDCSLPEDQPYMTILQGRFSRQGGKRWVKQQQTTTVFSRPQPTMDGLHHLIEACAGIGAVGYGMEHLGVRTACYVDCNPKFAAWTTHKSDVPSILGNIADLAVVAGSQSCSPSPFLSCAFGRCSLSAFLPPWRSES